MKSRPILFSGPMVRALLDGTKKQTRRVCKNKVYGNGEWNKSINDFICHNDYLPPSALLMDYRKGGYDLTTSNLEGWGEACPYGQTGDQLWVRETWGARFSHADFGGVALHWNDLRGPLKKYRTHQNLALYAMSANGQYCGGWIPSIHMPRWASRITLEITGVRVERLQDISEADAMAEGCTKNHNGYFWGGPHPESGLKQLATAQSAYQDLWESINGPGSWDVNPWVWVIEFRRLP